MEYSLNEATFLTAKVIKRSLPVFEGAPIAGAPVLKRLLLPQGELASFYDSDDPIRYLAFIELREGGVRGNHYHKIKEEWLYLIRGELLLLIQDVDSEQRASVSLKPGDLVTISTGMAHAMKTIVPGDAIEFSKARFNPEDIHRYQLG